MVVFRASDLLAGLFGTLVGLMSGFYGGWIDSIIMRFVDVQLSFPFVILALTIKPWGGSHAPEDSIFVRQRMINLNK